MPLRKKKPSKMQALRRKARRPKRLTKHHLTPSCRGGKTTPENILYIWRDKHEMFHFLFGNLTLEEIIHLLQRVARIKKGLKYAK